MRAIGQVGVVCLLVMACASEEAPVRQTEGFAASGRDYFVTYCAACHGVGATGDGPAGTALSTRPADLTRIALRNGGVFDKARVAAKIDGRDDVTAHGPREMPVWGRRFDDRGEAIAEETRLSPGAILLLVEYLASIQVPVEGTPGS